MTKVKNKTNSVTIRLTDEQKTNLKKKAELHGVTMTALLNNLIQAL